VRAFVTLIAPLALCAAAALPCSAEDATPAPPTLAASPSPSPSVTPLKEIGRVSGRSTNLVGKAAAASSGTIGQEQIATRPVLRPGEILEAIPGLVISQHSGEGKANQYYLRGFQLDHGTDLESTVAGVPINLPSHAHGQGYSDINWLIPELVSYVEFKKGPYYADQGDFSTAGAYNLFYRTTIAPTVVVSGGSYGFGRILTAASTRAGQGDLLYAVELVHDNGSFVKPDEYAKYNGVVRYALTKGADALTVTATGYSGAFDSTDQIPQRLVDDGTIGRYGYVDPSDGGNTNRYALSAQLTHRNRNGTTQVNAYGAYSFLDLFSNFTYDLFDADDYYNETANPVTCNPAFRSCDPYPSAHHTSDYLSYCPAYNTAPRGAAVHSVAQPAYTFACGDQREQLDKRFLSGFDVTRNFSGAHTDNTLGIGLRNDNIPENGLFLTNDRNRYAAGTLSDDHIVQYDVYAFAESQVAIGPRLRLMPGLRLDAYDFAVGAFNPANSGRLATAMLNPKFNAAYAATKNSEFYLDFGESFHSNDARSFIGADDPQTNRPYDPNGQPVYQNSPLVRAIGEELGYRYSAPKLTTTLSLFALHLSNELIFDGDHGTTSVGGPTMRKGIELSNFWNPRRWLTLDADFATATARFMTDPLHQGTAVPESLNTVVAAGATVDEPRYAASLRLRYFGPRVLDTQGDAFSTPSLLLSGGITLKLPHGLSWSLTGFNLLNADADDVEYYYGSWLPQDAAVASNANNPAINPILGGRAPGFQSVNGQGINDYHFHPSEKRSLRLALTKRL
jgi:hypothetical protein